MSVELIYLHNIRSRIGKGQCEMMQLAYLNGILVEACEYALCHQLDVVDACRQLETVQLSEFLQRSQNVKKLTSRHQILIELSLEALIKRVFCLGCMLREVTVFEWPLKEWIIFLCLSSFHTKM
jgi:hypothetical protein